MHHTSGRVGVNRTHRMNKDEDYEEGDEDLIHCGHCGRYRSPIRDRLYRVPDLPDHMVGDGPLKDHMVDRYDDEYNNEYDNEDD